MMKTYMRWIVIGMMALLTVVSVRAPGFAGWFSEDEESDSDADHEEEWYEEGTEALENGEWEEAVERFEEVADLKGRRADGALYWKAYALGKLRRLPQALSTIDQLTSTYPRSKWKDDAKALSIELKQSGGKPVPPEEDDSEELKLVAINGLMHMDPEKAVPMLERFLTGGSSRKLKEQALFVLVQTGTPRAREVVEKTARGQTNPALQRKAVELLGIFGGDGESMRLLKDIYATTQDDQVKRQVLSAYMVSGETRLLLEVARTERSESLRREAISYLGASGAEDELSQMYATETSKELRGEILQALAVSGSERLLDLAKREKDPVLRRKAVQSLGIMDGDMTSPVLLEIYATDKDLDVRRSVLDAFFIQGNARAIITIAEREKDPVMRRAAVEKLSVMGSKEASDYLMKLLEE